MVATMNTPVFLGSATCWAPGNGTIDVKTLHENDESVTFTGVIAGDNYGYQLWIDKRPSIERPRQIGDGSFTLTSNNTYTVTYNLTKVTAAQDGTTCQLLIIK